jgi:hypothetical protein
MEVAKGRAVLYFYMKKPKKALKNKGKHLSAAPFKGGFNDILA